MVAPRWYTCPLGGSAIAVSDTHPETPAPSNAPSIHDFQLLVTMLESPCSDFPVRRGGYR